MMLLRSNKLTSENPDLLGAFTAADSELEDASSSFSTTFSLVMLGFESAAISSCSRCCLLLRRGGIVYVPDLGRSQVLITLPWRASPDI
jgi:hypothetical protein